MDDRKPDPWQTFGDAWDALMLEWCKLLRIPQILDWITARLDRIAKRR